MGLEIFLLLRFDLILISVQSKFAGLLVYQYVVGRLILQELTEWYNDRHTV